MICAALSRLSLSLSFSSRRDSTQQHCIRGALDFDPVNLQRGPRKEDVAPLNPVMFFVIVMIASQRCIASASLCQVKTCIEFILFPAQTIGRWLQANPANPANPIGLFSQLLMVQICSNRIHSSNCHEISTYM